MKWLAVFLATALAWSCWAGEKITFVSVDGVFYDHIQDVHVVSGGRVAVMVADGGGTVSADKLPRAFLESWGITAEKLAGAKSAAEKRTASELNQAIQAGLFREVDGVVYDLRKPQADWVRLSGAKILAVTPEGALAKLPSAPTNPVVVAIHNLPPVYADGDTVSVFAKAAGPVSVSGRSGERTIRGYDVGMRCVKTDIPEAMLKNNLAFASVPNAPKAKAHPGFPRDRHQPHAIGSGFFVTRDGYLITNHHVIAGAEKIEVRYQGQVFRAQLVADDQTNDLALLKVAGDHFEALSISSRDTVDLGQEVFTIGFPNIQMQGIDPKYTDGKISSLAGMEDDPTEYQISVPVQPGNSGGPLCDTRGEVVGVVVARLNDMTMLETSGVVPQNVNYAVKSKLAAQLLQNVKGLNLTPNQLPSGNPVKTVENATAMLVIY